TGDTLVLSRVGIQAIEQHWGPAEKEPDTFREHVVQVAGKDCETATSHVYYGGVRDTVRIRTYLGLELEGTPNHRVWAMTASGPAWVCLEALGPGDRVAVRRGDD